MFVFSIERFALAFSAGLAYIISVRIPSLCVASDAFASAGFLWVAFFDFPNPLLMPSIAVTNLFCDLVHSWITFNGTVKK